MRASRDASCWQYVWELSTPSPNVNESPEQMTRIRPGATAGWTSSVARNRWLLVRTPTPFFQKSGIDTFRFAIQPRSGSYSEYGADSHARTVMSRKNRKRLMEPSKTMTRPSRTATLIAAIFSQRNDILLDHPYSSS